MRTLTTRIGALLAASALVACGGGADAPGSDPLGATDTVVLRSGSAVPVGSGALTLELVDVRDSRCPVDAVCVWAGQATVAVQARHAGQAPATVWLGTPAPAAMQLPGDALVHGWRLKLQALEPAPRAAVSVPLAQYRATVVAERVL